jgi:hypothetical protein
MKKYCLFIIIFCSIFITEINGQFSVHTRVGVGINNIFAGNSPSGSPYVGSFEYTPRQFFYAGFEMEKKVNSKIDIGIGSLYTHYQNRATDEVNNQKFNYDAVFDYTSFMPFVKYQFCRKMSVLLGVNNNITLFYRGKNGTDLSYSTIRPYCPQIVFGPAINVSERIDFSIHCFADIASFADNYLESASDYRYYRYGISVNLGFRIFKKNGKQS